MGCSSCGTEKGSTPKGCKSNGHCQTGGCNVKNTFDWFSDFPIAFGIDDYNIHEVAFKSGVSKLFCKNLKKLEVNTGDYVVISLPSGEDVGEITLSGELVKLQMKKKKQKETDSLPTVSRKATENDIKKMEAVREKEKEALIKSRVIVNQLKLNMKMSDIQFQSDEKKATFYYIADGRVDFRELIKILASTFKVKIEMKQINARHEAGIVGGIGSCGRELCCSTWLSDFKSVNIDRVRKQNLSINMQKISGQCGRLKCCLNYELDTYLEALTFLPINAQSLDTKSGKLVLQKTDILSGTLFYAYEGKWDKIYPFTIEQVNQLKENIEKGILIDSVYQIIEEKVNENKEAYQDLVGHITLDTLDKKSKKSKNHKKNRSPKAEAATPQESKSFENLPKKNQRNFRNKPYAKKKENPSKNN